jgi:hypothetical protein
VHLLCWTTAWLVFPKSPIAAGEIGEGARTSDQAAVPELSADPITDFTLAGWKPSYSFLANSAPADTTELEFPIEEEENRKHLIRDIGIFIVVSAFLAFFIVKVFIEEEEEAPPPEDPGKEIPGTIGITRALQTTW